MGFDNTDVSGLHDYKVQQKIISARPVFEIFDEQTGEKIAEAKQTWLSFLRTTMHITDVHGNRLMTAKGGFFDRTFWLLDESGQKIAKLVRPWIQFRKAFTITYRDDIIKAQGGFLAIGFDAYSSTGEFAFRLDKKIFKIRDTIRVSNGTYMDPLHAIASALVIDRVFFKGKSCGCGCLIVCLLPVIVILAVLMLLSGLFYP
ncbi:MAG: hypothetical protein ACTSUO_02280 [Candidatus Thorarchaeota archaeon]